MKYTNLDIIDQIIRSNLINAKKNISIITIHKGQIENLIKTLNSIDNQKVKNFKNYVISPFIPKTELKKFKKKYRKFIIGKDKSLYNAMNIGLSYT